MFDWSGAEMAAFGDLLYNFMTTKWARIAVASAGLQ